MRKEMKFLSLDDTFDIDLRDYITPTSGEGAPVIPANVATAQPIVGTQVNTAQTGQTNELTPTELAVLSPSEQIIRLREKNKIT